MNSILLIQFRINQEVAEEERNIFQAIFEDREYSVSLESVDAMDDTLLWDEPEKIIGGHSGVVIGGSGELAFSDLEVNENGKTLEKVLERIEPIMQHIFVRDIPTLGICLGHQIIGHFLGAKVVCDERQSKFCSHKVMLLDDGKSDPLFKGIEDDAFIAQYGHKDSLSGLPEGCQLLSNGAKCAYSAIRYKNNVYGTQFHPELDDKGIKRRLDAFPDYLPKDVVIEASIEESPHAVKVIDNFIELALKKDENALEEATLSNV